MKRQTMKTIITEASPASPCVWSAPALLAAVSTALAFGGDPVIAALRYDRVLIAHGEWWRLLTGNLVHLGAWHLFLNALSLALLVLLCPQRMSAFEWLRRLVLVGIGMSIGLYLFVPGLPTYVGLSGLIYGLFVLGLGHQAAQRDGIAIASLAFLAARIGWELVIGAPASEQALIGGAVVAESHLYGVVAALLYGVVFRVFSAPRPRTKPNEHGVEHA